MKIVKILSEDNLTSINSKIAKILNEENLYFLIEEKGTIIEKQINLKILKKQIEKQNSVLKIATNIKPLLTISESLKIPTISPKELKLIENLSKNENSSSGINIKHSKILSSELKIKPIKFMTNEEETKKVKYSEKKDKNELASKNKENKIFFFFTKQFSNIKNFFESKNKIFKRKNKILGKSIFAFLTISLIVFLFVMFVSYPRASLTVALDSHSEENIIQFKISKNISFTDLNQKTIPAFVEVRDIEGQKEVSTQNADISGTKSSGKIRIYNDQDSPQGLLDQTQLQPKGGSKIFRIQGAVTIPAKSSVLVSVVADSVGDDGNLDPTDFIIVKLSPYLQTLVYGKSEEKFSGGTTVRTPNVSASEIDSQKGIFSSEFSESKTKEVIDELNKSSEKIFISGSEKVEITMMDASVNVGDKVDSYLISAKGKVSVLGFKSEDLKFLVSEIAKQNLLEGEVLDTFEVSNISVVSKNGLIDAEIRAEVKLFIISDLDKEELKNKISGKSRLDALTILESTPGIREVKELTFFPSWFKTVPVSSSNIKIDFIKAPSMKISETKNNENVQAENSKNIT